MSRPTDNALSGLVGDLKAIASPLRAKLREIHEKYRSVNDGAPADYIPELAKADPAWFGLAVTTVEGQTFSIGDTERSFTIQSISKPFMYGLALEDHGRDVVMNKVGVEPSGDPFNSMMKLEGKAGRPFNPMINAGAIAVAGLIKGDGEADRLNRVLEMFGKYLGREPLVDAAVFTSERATGHRNRSIGHFLLNYGIIGPDVEATLDLYFKQCSLRITAADLAMMGATLANGGVNPKTGVRAIRQEFLQDMLSVMATCGMYDYSGEWAYRVGLSAKSGVGGGICAVVPGVAGIAAFSPPLDSRGNSVRGILAIEHLSREYGLHVYASHNDYKAFREAIGGRLRPRDNGQV